MRVIYGQPARRGRQVFGEVVPFGKVWRTGANEATEFILTKEILIGGKPLKAGTYTLFTMPNPDKWTILVNTDLGQWGDYKYDKTKDILSFEVPVEKLPNERYEAFTMIMEETAAGCNLILRWDDTRVTIPITISTKKSRR